MGRLSRGMLAAVVVGAAALAGCAGDVVDIDRTQPNKVSKAIFEGEWYFNATVVETEFNQGLLFEGLMGGSDRISWEIREDVLIAHRSYATLENAEEGSTDAVEFQGSVVAMFPIQSHFDVWRDYNTATGEQRNVLVENTTDRPWWEREYVRVDWAQNLVADGYNLSGVVSAIAAAPYYVQDFEVDNPYRAEVTSTNINVVGNYILEPDVWVCSGAFADPWCGASTAKMKLSFRKVDEKNDYQALSYPDGRHFTDNNGNKVRDCDGDNDGVFDGDCENEQLEMFSRFGFFRTERRRFDDEALWTRDGRIFLANRHNIWKRSTNTEGTPIPMEHRETKTFTYFTNVDFPENEALYAANDELVGQWDEAFRNTVAQLRSVSGNSTAISDVPAVFEWKKNSCNIDAAQAFADREGFEDELKQFGITAVNQANVKRACSVLEYVSEGKFSWEKVGDLRHSFLHWVDTPQQAGPLGYGPVAADPITGEIVSGYANVYGASIETYASYAADIAGLLGGNLDEQQFAQGSTIREQMEARSGFGSQFQDSQAQQMRHDTAKMQQMRTRFAKFKDRIAARDPLLASKIQHSLDDRLEDFLHQSRKGDVNESAVDKANFKLDRIAGSRIEKELLLTDEIKAVMHGSAALDQAAASGEALEYKSPVKWLQETRERDLERETLVGGASIMMAEWADEGALWLGKELEGRPYEEVYDIAIKEIYRAVQAHEVGHTLGLRHNFEGSFDALNFHDEFWSNYDPATETVKRLDSTGAPTGADKYMYSTIMDYMPRPFDDWAGIGKYDRAAIAFGYGQLVEVFEKGVPAFYLETLQFFNDYGRIPRLLAGDMGCDPSAPSADNCHPDMLAALTGGADFSDAVNSYLFKAKSYGAAAADAADALARINSRKFMRFDDFYANWEKYYRQEEGGFEDALFNVIAVPYGFCPDERVYPSNTECQRWDKGANYREIVMDQWERYDDYYWFTNYKRDRASFNDSSYINSYISRIFERHLGPMSTIYQNYLYGDYIAIGYDLEGNYLTLNDFDTGVDWQAAALDGLNYLATVVHTPEPGTYCLNGAGDAFEPLEQDETCASGNTMEVPLGVGKQLRTTWTDEYYYKATVVGHFWDKYIALFSMTDNTGFFYQNAADLLDSGAFSLSYWRGLPEEMLEFFSSAYDGQAGEYAWRYDGTQNAGARFVPTPVVDQYATGPDLALAKIQPSDSWTLRYYGITLPMARFNSFYDYTQDFSYYTRICLEGYSDCVTYDQPVERYTDPLTQYTYMAPTLGEAEGHDLAAQMLRDASDYATNAYEPAKLAHEEAMANPDTFVFTAEEQDLVNGGADRADIRLRREVSFSKAKRSVNERTSFLDIVRDISQRTEFGG